MKHSSTKQITLTAHYPSFEWDNIRARMEGQDG